MINIILFIMVILITIIFIQRNYKKLNTEGEKILFILYIIIFYTPILIYYLDLWNIPSKLNLTDCVDSQNWLSYLANYTSSIVSALISSVVSIFLVFFQIRKNNEDIDKRDKENFRLQNIPILKYRFDTESDVSPDNLLVTNVEDDSIKTYNLTLEMKNIGLNNIRGIKLFIEEESLNVHEYLLGAHSLEVMEKNEIKLIQRYFRLEGKNKCYNFKITVQYEDVINNLYEQIINIKYYANDFVKQGKRIGSIDYTIEKEIIINEMDKNK